MKILAIDTATDVCSVCILENDDIISEKTLDTINTHSVELMPLIDTILKVASLAIVYKESNKVIGVISLPKKLDGIYELGYSLEEKYWGKGIMTEATKALVDYAFKTLNAYEIDAGCFIDNYRSERVLLKCGFKYVGIHEKDYHNYDDKYVDCKRFRLTKDEYGG